ncbi:sn-glycerol-3-phosphate ABC transporter permease [Williamsoniiplasma somnilux]|uniref:sn-glycerol-3-phosphate ABC transporter permease n=1 Tax=Williamsoniiplasma somnilux TaxID=215578 RepID=A0A2K8P0Y8_9MOLU|nr:sugar ABC transporter permease [Williamsoniiplasma somnilux]ATZ18563.1 sn-glycerol-3-phosphate ABC transporter permease [Williamsoniiplasma somnilux]
MVVFKKNKGFNITHVNARKRKQNKKNFDSFFLQLIWIIPGLFFIGVFVFFSLYMVIKNGTNGSPRPIYEWYLSAWNFKAILTDQTFLIALKNSLLYVVVTVPIGLVISILCAKALSSILNKRIFSFVQGVFFLPYVTSAMAVAMAFSFIFSSSSGGVFNQFMGLFGIDSVAWLKDSRYAIFTVFIFGIWKTLPFQIVMLTSAFIRINKQYYAAASIDGMSKWKQFWRITMPQLTPMIVYLTTLALIASFKVLPLGLFGNEAEAEKVNAQTIIFWIYERTTGSSTNAISYPKAGAASLFLMFIILAVTVVNRFITKKLAVRYK